MDSTASSFWQLPEWLDSTGGALSEDKIAPAQGGVETTPSSEPNEMYIASPNTEFPAVANWLADVESLIRNSIAPSRHSDLITREWLDRDAALAAIVFFRDSCDLLPSEPFVYGTAEGEMVAEFETADLRVTTVVSLDNTILFGYRRDRDDFPTQCIIRHGSNSRRDEVKAFTKALGTTQNGQNLET